MKALLKSFCYAANGIRLSTKQRNMRIHLCFTFYVVLGGIFADISKSEWALVLICIAGVLSAEGFNTAIEALCDQVTMERREGIKAAKDVAAGAVLICAAFAAIIGVMIFFSRDKLERAWSFALAYPGVSVPALLFLPLWIFYIFRREKK